jgi:hypothetical protein
MENPPKFTSQPNLAQAPTSPSTPRNYAIPRRHPEQSQSLINLWFQLFFDILEDEQLTEKLRNTLYLILGNEGTLDAIVRTNLPEKNTQRIQRIKVRIGKYHLQVISCCALHWDIQDITAGSLEDMQLSLHP